MSIMFTTPPARADAEGTTDEGFAPFVDILALDEPTPLFPTEILPQPFQNFVEDIADRLQVPTDFPAIPTLIGAATMLGHEFRLAPLRHDDWSERPCLWGLLVGCSGVAKTPSVESALRPVKAIQKEMITDWQVRHDAWQKEPERDRGHEPVPERIITADATAEALARLMTERGNANPRGLLLYRDELAGWHAAMNKYNNGADDRQFFLQCWSGGQFHVDRIKETRYVENCFLNIFGTIQPKIAVDVFRDGERDGLTARFGLTVWPELPDSVAFVDRQPDWEARNTVTERLREIRHAKHDGSVLRFNGEGYVIFEKWSGHNANRPERRNDSSFGIHIAKYPALFARLALTLHFMQYGTKAIGMDVSGKIAWNVEKLIDSYLEPHARKLYGGIEAHPAKEGAVQIARWIKESNEGGKRTWIKKFTTRDVYRKCWRVFSHARDPKAAILTALELLDAKGWVRLVEKSSTVRGGRPTVVAIVNPKVFG